MTTTRIKAFGGNIGIGTDDPGSYKLNVNGIVKANSLVVNGVTNSGIPIGLIEMWSGTVATIPEGWALCNGQSVIRSDNGASITTPNLTNLFVRGAVGDNPSPAYPGQSGGSNTVTISSTNLPSHTHPFGTSTHNVPHSHGATGNHQVIHAHNTATHQAGHGHAIQGGSANHDHGQESGNANITHDHSVNQVTAAHAHGTQGSGANHLHSYPNVFGTIGIGAGTGRKLKAAPSFTTGTTNVPHTHSTDTVNMPHSHGMSTYPGAHGHGCPQVDSLHGHVVPTTSSNAPHNHGGNTSQDSTTHAHSTGNSNANHSHEGTTASTGQGTAITITNPYRVLAYIMKI